MDHLRELWPKNVNATRATLVGENVEVVVKEGGIIALLALAVRMMGTGSARGYQQSVLVEALECGGLVVIGKGEFADLTKISENSSASDDDEQLQS